MAAPKIREALRNATMGLAALGGIASASPAMANDAEVQQVAAVQDIRIPVRDMQGNQVRGVQMSAAMVSKGSQVIVFYGDSREALDQTFVGAKQAVAAGVPLAGVIVASPAEPEMYDGEMLTGSNRIELYADGQSTGIFDHVDRQPHLVAGKVRDELLRGQDIMQSRRQVVMAVPSVR